MPSRWNDARTPSGVSPWGTLNLSVPVFRSSAVNTPYGGLTIGSPSRPLVNPPRPPAGVTGASAAPPAATHTTAVATRSTSGFGLPDRDAVLRLNARIHDRQVRLADVRRRDRRVVRLAVERRGLGIERRTGPVDPPHRVAYVDRTG